MTHPTIAQVYAKHLAALTLRTPFGVLLKPDREALVKATARDAGVTVEEVQAWLRDDLSQAIRDAAARYAAMSPAERHAMIRAQAASFARAEAGFGSDADEAAWREAHRTGDTKTLKRLEAEAAARVLAVDRVMGVGNA